MTKVSRRVMLFCCIFTKRQVSDNINNQKRKQDKEIKKYDGFFTRNHPKFVPFVQAVGREAMADGTIIEVKVTSPDGREYNTNMKITQSDLDLFAQLKGMM